MTDDINEEPTLAAGRWAGAYAPPTATATATESPSGVGPEPEAPKGSDRARWIGLAVVVALIAGAAGFLGTLAALDAQDSATVATAPAPNGTAPGTTVPRRPADPKATALNGLIVQQSDLPSGATIEKLPDWNDAVNTATLDLCNGKFPSESTRTARRQVETFDASGNGGLSTEAVLYKTPADATRAFADLHKVVATCPKTPVNSPVGEATITTVFHAPPDAKWASVPGIARLAYDFTTTDQQGNTNRSIAVYLRRGRALMGLYFPSTGAQQPIQGKTSIPDITTIFAKRMAALPADVVN
jgi:hypothetical protein